MPAAFAQSSNHEEISFGERQVLVEHREHLGLCAAFAIGIETQFAGRFLVDDAIVILFRRFAGC